MYLIISRDDGGVSVRNLSAYTGNELKIEIFRTMHYIPFDGDVPETDSQGNYVWQKHDNFLSCRLTDESLPDYYFRDAWIDNNGVLDINIEKARNIHISRIRDIRDKAFLEFDKRYIAAERDGKDLTELKAEREWLKDIPQETLNKIQNIISPLELKNFWPEGLAHG